VERRHRRVRVAAEVARDDAADFEDLQIGGDVRVEGDLRDSVDAVWAGDLTNALDGVARADVEGV
jgi:hypothetical protein